MRSNNPYCCANLKPDCGSKFKALVHSFMKHLSFQAIFPQLMFKLGGWSHTNGLGKCFAATFGTAPKRKEVFSVSKSITGHNSWQLMSAKCMLILYSPEMCLSHRQCCPCDFVKWKSYVTVHSGVMRLSGRREGYMSLLFKMQKAFQKAV